MGYHYLGLINGNPSIALIFALTASLRLMSVSLDFVAVFAMVDLRPGGNLVLDLRLIVFPISF